MLNEEGDVYGSYLLWRLSDYRKEIFNVSFVVSYRVLGVVEFFNQVLGEAINEFL